MQIVKLRISHVKSDIKLKSLQLFKQNKCSSMMYFKDPCVKCMQFFGIHNSLLFDNKKKKKTIKYISVQFHHLFKSHENKFTCLTKTYLP